MSALAWLLVEALAPFELAADATVYALAAGPLVLLCCVLAWTGLWLASTRDPERRRRLRREAFLTPCAFAPLAVLAPWVVAPSAFGPSYGSFPFFVAWLTRYPTFGPVNHEVLLGIGAVLGACAMPSVLAVYATTRRSLRPHVVATLALLQLVAYVPVFVRLDQDLLAYAVIVARGGTTTLLGPVSGAWWQNTLSALSGASGALLRLGATLTMIAFVPLTMRAEEPVAVWETD